MSPTELARRVHLGLRRPSNWMQLVKFGAVGASGYVLNLAVFAALVKALEIHYIAAAVLAFCVAVTNNFQQADTGTKMIHIGKNTKSIIVSKGISAGHGQNTYRGLVKILAKADNSRNYSQCDSLLIGDKCGAHTFPVIEVLSSTAQMEHEASTSKIGEDQIFYFQQRGISAEEAVNMIVNGFCKVVFKELPMEFAVEAQKLLGVSLEGSVG